MPLKVLMFGWEFPPHNSGGLGTACFGLTKALAKQGAEIIFVLPKKIDARAEWLKVRFADLPELSGYAIASPIYPYITSETYVSGKIINPPLYGQNLIDEVRRYGCLAAEIARREKFDVIHAHDWLSFPAGLAAKEVSGKPLVVHVHATEFDRTGGSGVNQEVYQIEREGMEKSDTVLSVSNWTKNIITRHYGISPEKVSVVHNGVEVNYRPLADRLSTWRQGGNKLVLFVGRITLQKGPDYFVRAAARVLALEPKTYFIIAGSGDMEGQIIRQAAALGIADRVIFVGFVRGDDLDALYQAADLYVLPSVSEPFGITPLEAMANGTPVIVSRQSGVAEVIRHALTVDFWDVEELANQIISVLRHQPLHQTLKHYGGEEVRRVTWLVAAEKCLAVYRRLVSA